MSVVKNAGLHERDLLGRWGGEEFILLMSNSSLERAAETAEAFRSAVASHTFKYEDVVIPITVSIGAANVSKDHTNYIDLYKVADQALYHSKENGKNQVTFAKSKD